MTCKDCIHEKVCDALIKSGCPYLDEEVPADAFCMEFRNTADVVPKSEVEQIFEEIERFLYMHFRFCKEEIGNDDTKYFEGRLELNTQIQNFIAELRKKYTENCTTCKHMVSCEPNPFGSCDEYTEDAQ